MRDTTFSTRIPTISQLLPISARRDLLGRIVKWPRHPVTCSKLTDLFIKEAAAVRQTAKEIGYEL